MSCACPIRSVWVTSISVCKNVELFVDGRGGRESANMDGNVSAIWGRTGLNRLSFVLASDVSRRYSQLIPQRLERFCR